MSLFDDLPLLAVPAVMVLVGVAAIIYMRREWLRFVGSE